MRRARGTTWSVPSAELEPRPSLGAQQAQRRVEALETELSTLSKQLAAQAQRRSHSIAIVAIGRVPGSPAQLDDHSSALASLRVRTEGQEILANLLGFL